MKTPKSLYSRLALTTSVTLVVGYFVVYAAWTGILDSEIVPSATITSTLMTKIKNNLDYLSGGLANFTFSSGKVGIGTATPQATLDVNGSISGQGPAGEAVISSSFSAPTGGNTIITGFTTTASVTVGGGFDATTGTFQPTVAGRYLFTIAGYSSAQGNWIAGIIKNNATGVSGGAVAVSGNGNFANASYVFNLNGSSDYVNFKITNYSGVTAYLNPIRVTWTKLP